MDSLHEPPDNQKTEDATVFTECSAAPEDHAQREHLLAALRCASLRTALAKADLDSVGTALKGGLIPIESAMDWLGELGALPLIETVLEGSRA